MTEIKTRKDVMIIGGTRPEVIKLAPVIYWLDRLRISYSFIWTGQHYDYEMSNIFFEQLRIPKPDENLNIKEKTHSAQTAKIMLKLEETIERHNPSIIISLGDTNSVVASALASTKKNIPFAHIEAGLRSWDRTMPEEINRIIADAVAHLHFAPTEIAAINLMHEGIPFRKIHITGNTIVDVVYKYNEKALKFGKEILEKLNLDSHGYLLATVHRQENTENITRMSNIIKSLITLAENHRIVFPIHPRTLKRLKRYGFYNMLKNNKNIILLKPIGYMQFLGLLALSQLVLTDSGGIQEEAYVLKKPTITLRYNTERPETVIAGINKLVGTETHKIVEETLKMIENSDQIIERLTYQKNAFGDGTAGKKIATILKSILDNAKSLVSSPDHRYSNYMIYTLVEKQKYYLYKEQGEIIGMYNGNNIATCDIKKAKIFLMRTLKNNNEFKKE